jgi:hypothetical protein
MKLQSVWTKKKSEIFDVSFLLPFMLLYRKENSESDSYCRHNVRSSRLFLSRRKWNPLIFLPRISKSTPCKGIYVAGALSWKSVASRPNPVRDDTRRSSSRRQLFAADRLLQHVHQVHRIGRNLRRVVVERGGKDFEGKAGGRTIHAFLDASRVLVLLE